MSRHDLVTVEQVRILAPAGELIGSLYTPAGQGGSLPGLILTHCLGGGRYSLHWHATFLCSLNFAVVTYDLAGHVDSPGTAGARVLDDLRAVVAWARRQPAINPDVLVLGGLCVGGNLSIYLALEEPSVRAVFGSAIVPEPFNLREYVWEFMAKSITNPADCPGMRAWDEADYRAFLAEHDVVKAAAGLKVPLLLIQYARDRMVTRRIARQAYDRAGGPKRMAVLDGGYHTAFLRDPQAAWLLFDWLTDLRAKGHLPVPSRSYPTDETGSVLGCTPTGKSLTSPM